MGALIRTAKRFRAKDPRRDRRRQGPFSVRFYWHGERRLLVGGDVHRLRLLINSNGNDGGTDQDSCDGGRIGGKPGKIQPEHEVASALQTNSPERLPEQFIALAAVKLVQEILEVTGGRLFVAFQPEQRRNFSIVKVVHFSARLFMRPDSSGIRPNNFAAVDSRKRAWNVPSPPRHARFY